MITLYAFDTPNGRKISVALEEMELPYRVEVVDILNGGQFAPDFLKVSPNNRIPAIVDDEGPDGKPISVFESGAVLIYLGEKTGKFWPADPRAHVAVLEWLMFQMGGFGPILGQVHHFNAVKDEGGPALWARTLQQGDRPSLWRTRPATGRSAVRRRRRLDRRLRPARLGLAPSGAITSIWLTTPM